VAATAGTTNERCDRYPAKMFTARFIFGQHILGCFGNRITALTIASHLFINLCVSIT
jgi:hypothetical protein